MAHSSGTRRGMILAGVIALAVSLPAFGQGGGTGGGGGGTGAGGGAGGGGAGGGGAGGGGTGGGGLGGGGAGGGPGGGGPGGGAGMGAGGRGTTGAGLGSGTASGASGSGPSSSNFLAPNFAYPTVTALGTVGTGTNAQTTQSVASSVSHTVPPYGGPTYKTTTGTTGGRAGRTTGSATIRGGSNSSGSATINGFNGGTTGSQLSRMPHYAASLRFKTAPVSAQRVMGDVADVIARSSDLPSKQRIQVSVDGRDVILRGEVASDDERRQVEGLVRLTPGVGTIFNELKVKE